MQDRGRSVTERVAGIEPALQLWKSRLRPLQHTRASGTPTVRAIAVAVRTNDIALSDLGEDGFGTGPTDHLGDGVALLSAVTMVELHNIEGESLPAVHTRNVAKFGQQIGMRFPVGALLFDSRRDTFREPRQRRLVRLNPRVRSDRVTIGADDVALRDLLEQELACLQEHLSRRDRELLFARIPVIEVHDPRRKGLSAVRAWPTSEVTKKLEC